MALSGSQLTRIGTIGFPGRAYAGFTPKEAAEIVVEEVVTSGAGGYFNYPHPRKKKTKEELRLERIRLGILQDEGEELLEVIEKTAEKVAEKKIVAEKPIPKKATVEELKKAIQASGIEAEITRDIKLIYESAIIEAVHILEAAKAEEEMVMLMYHMHTATAGSPRGKNGIH